MPGRSWLWRSLFLALLLLTLPASAQDADWSGVWDSRWRDGGAELYLEQDGDLVTGVYPVLEGEIRGETRGRLLVGTWRDPGGRGEFVFAMAPDGQSFMGRFGTGEWWTGERLSAAVGGDAITADASSPPGGVAESHHCRERSARRADRPVRTGASGARFLGSV